MELCVFAPDDGYAEAIIRGLRASFLTEAHYNQMKNCSTMAELKSVNYFNPLKCCFLHDFSIFLANILSSSSKKQITGLS